MFHPDLSGILSGRWRQFLYKMDIFIRTVFHFETYASEGSHQSEELIRINVFLTGTSNKGILRGFLIKTNLLINFRL